MEELSFEQSMQELEKIVQELEKGNLNLEDTIKKFEQGIALSKQCNEFLENTEKKITMLIKTEEGIEEQNF